MRKYIANFILLSLSFGVALVLTEAILRIFQPSQLTHTGREFVFYSFDSKYGWKGKPYASGDFSRYGEYLVHVKNNSDGMRDDEYPAQKENGVVRFAFMGDSYTWGFGVEHDRIFMEILEKEYLINAQVFNLGISGYSTVQSFLLFKDMNSKYNFDYAVLVYNIGDMKRNIMSDDNGYSKPYAEYKGGQLIIKNIPVKEKTSVQSGLKSRLYLLRLASLAKSRLMGKAITVNNINYKTYNYGIPSGDVPFHVINDGRNDYDYEVTKAILNDMKEYCERHKIKFIVMINTGAWQFDEDYKKRAMENYKGDPNLVDWELPQKKMTSILSELDIPHLNLLPFLQKGYAYTGKYPHFRIDGHYSPDGHKMIADALAGYLLENNLLDKSYFKIK